MNIILLDSQLKTLEPPQIDEFSFKADINASVNDIVKKIEYTILNEWILEVVGNKLLLLYVSQHFNFM